MLKLEKQKALISSCMISKISKTCKFYLVLQIMTFVVWKHSYRRFSKKFVLFNFYLLGFVSIAFSHLPYILTLDLFVVVFFLI